MPASPSRMWASAAARSGMEMRPLIVVAQTMPWRRIAVTWSAINATNGEITTVSAPVAA